MPGRPPLRIGIDTGGTFTDLVVEGPDGRRHAKVPSTPADPAAAFEAALALAAVPDGVVPDVRHGTTVGTNAVLTRQGARVVFVGTAGHADVLQIGRGVRRELFALQPAREAPLVAAADGIEAPGGTVTGKRMLALSRRGGEAVSYWMRIGGLFSEDAWDTRLHILKEGLKGRVPDGVLVRASVRVRDARDAETAWPLAESFLSDLAEASPEAVRRVLLGWGDA